MILEELAKAGNEGLTIYALSNIRRPGQSRIYSPNTISQALTDFEKCGFAIRKEERYRERKPYFITKKGKDALEVAKAVYDIEESSKSITREMLVEKFNENIVEDVVRAGLLREKTPQKKDYHMESTFTIITSL